MCHVSHLYPSGASLYFTYIARQERGSELDQWRAAKQAAGDAIMAHGGTITHHHAVGRDHAPWMEAEVGALGIDVLRAVKERVDPSGIMNPGKLLPEGRLIRERSRSAGAGCGACPWWCRRPRARPRELVEAARAAPSRPSAPSGR